jgi:hypothetical protein
LHGQFAGIGIACGCIAFFHKQPAAFEGGSSGAAILFGAEKVGDAHSLYSKRNFASLIFVQI